MSPVAQLSLTMFSLFYGDFFFLGGEGTVFCFNPVVPSWDIPDEGPGILTLQLLF